MAKTMAMAKAKTLAMAMAAILMASASADAFRIAAGPTVSGGEIRRRYGEDMLATTGIYALGANLAFETRSAELSLQAETGRHGGSPSYGAGLECSGKFGLLRDNLKFYAGLGAAYNGFAEEKWAADGTRVDGFSHQYSPYFTAKTEAWQRVRLGFEGLFHSRIFWKARLGFILLRFD